MLTHVGLTLTRVRLMWTHVELGSLLRAGGFLQSPLQGRLRKTAMRATRVQLAGWMLWMLDYLLWMRSGVGLMWDSR